MAVQLGLCDFLYDPNTSAGMKAQPKHGGPNVLTIPAQGQILDSGKRSNGFAFVEWAGHWGWILTSNIIPL